MNTLRRVGRILAVVGALAVVLTGAIPAEAKPRTQAVGATNAAAGNCFEFGGDPYVYEYTGAFVVTCVWGDGSSTGEYFTYDD